MHISDVPGPDFTTYREIDEEKFLKVLPEYKTQDGKPIKEYSYPIPLPCEWGGKPFSSRALICRAYREAFWSVTLRCDEEINRPDPEHDYIHLVTTGFDTYVEEKLKHNLDMEESYKEDYGLAKLKDLLGYCPIGHPDYKGLINEARAQEARRAKEARAQKEAQAQEASGIKEPGGSNKKPGEDDRVIFLNEIYTICRVLYDILFPGTEATSHTSGLIAITGATDSSKSLITRGLIFLFLQHAAEQARKAKLRKPHLLTFEDPIEQYYIKDPATKTAPATSAELESILDAIYIDYTPREKGADVDSLSRVTKDALRQTPAVLFVGETRDKEDWKELLQFAGSGHLVITTSHAGSVVEALGGIFRDTDTKTPSQRSAIARRVLGIINIRSYSPAGSRLRALVPALWKRTPQSINNLTADGLASILPARDQESSIGYYGRVYFAKQLTEKDKDGKSRLRKEALDYIDNEAAANHNDPNKPDPLKIIKRKAREWDINGV